jgi:hypothetical protein
MEIRGMQSGMPIKGKAVTSLQSLRARVGIYSFELNILREEGGASYGLSYSLSYRF